MKSLAVTGIQTDIDWENKEQNLQHLSEKIKSLPDKQKIVFLPEMFATGFSMNTALAEPMGGFIVSWMKDLSVSAGKIICGSVMVRENGDIFNRLIWMQPNGSSYHYDKRHLFAFGNEDRFFSSGQKRLVVQVNGWRISLLICYDLRFPVWCRQQQEKYDVLAFVANWPEKRIHAWRTLLQARAIENQCYVIGVNRIGNDGNGILHSGNSLIVDPLGRIVCQAEEGRESLLQWDLEPDVLQEARTHFPFLEDADPFLLL